MRMTLLHNHSIQMKFPIILVGCLPSLFLSLVLVERTEMTVDCSTYTSTCGTSNVPLLQLWETLRKLARVVGYKALFFVFDNPQPWLLVARILRLTHDKFDSIMSSRYVSK